MPDHPTLRHGALLAHGAAHAHDHDTWTRRDFVTRMGLAAAGVSFLMGRTPTTAFARSPLLAPVDPHADRILVLVQLAGGNDGLNTLVPHGNDVYYSKRPTIGIPSRDVLRLDDGHGLHPALDPLMPLWGDGRMAVVHNVGYQQQSRSHFRGTDVWSTGSDADQNLTTGWTGRYLADAYDDLLANPPAFPLAVRVGGGPSVLFQSDAGNLGMTFSDSDAFARFLDQGGFYDPDRVPDTTYGRELAFARTVTNASYRYVAAVQDAAGRAANRVEYAGGGLGRNLSVVARMIRGGLGTRLFLVSQGGYDTHAAQGGSEGRHASLMADLGGGVASFLGDLAADGLDERVAVMTFSEFGRTLAENGSGGTDHGAGAPLFLFGRGLTPGLFGAPSPLTPDALYGGDPRSSTDYRQVYSTLLERWFGLDGALVDGFFPRRFDRLGFLSGTSTSAAYARGPGGGLALSVLPHPVRQSAAVRMDLPAGGRARLVLFDAQGRRVALLAEGTFAAGRHDAGLDASALAPGLYLARLDTDGGSATHPITVVR
jgi:uncharacterized protein (DUF1501 family)